MEYTKEEQINLERIHHMCYKGIKATDLTA